MPFEAGVEFLSSRLMKIDPAYVLKNWECKYIEVRVDMRAGAMLIKPGNERTESSAKELLPCPFCGSRQRGPHFHEWDSAHGGYWWIECSGPEECCVVEVMASKEAVTERWNRRFTPPPGDSWDANGSPVPK